MLSIEKIRKFINKNKVSILVTLVQIFMKKNSPFKILLGLFLSMIFFVSSSQDYSNDYVQFGKWTFGEAEDRFALVNLESKRIENTTLNPFLCIDVFKNDGGTVGIRVNGEDIYNYNKDRNYIQLDFIVDDSEIFEFTSRVMKSNSDDWETEIKLTRMEDEPSLFDLFDLMKKGENIYVQTTGSGDPKVWSFELEGFRDAYTMISKKWNEWKQKQKKDNPFKKKDNNPFRK